MLDIQVNTRYFYIKYYKPVGKHGGYIETKQCKTRAEVIQFINNKGLTKSDIQSIEQIKGYDINEKI